jgi:transcriptional regulator with XRE-family HTH domain
MDDVHRQLTKRIKELARAKGLSANRLADFAGLGRGFVSNVLTGKKSPTVRTLSKVAKALDVEVRDLFA